MNDSTDINDFLRQLLFRLRDEGSKELDAAEDPELATHVQYELAEADLTIEEMRQLRGMAAALPGTQGLVGIIDLHLADTPEDPEDDAPGDQAVSQVKEPQEVTSPEGGGDAPEQKNMQQFQDFLATAVPAWQRPGLTPYGPAPENEYFARAFRSAVELWKKITGDSDDKDEAEAFIISDSLFGDFLALKRVEIDLNFYWSSEEGRDLDVVIKFETLRGMLRHRIASNVKLSQAVRKGGPINIRKVGNLNQGLQQINIEKSGEAKNAGGDGV